AKYALVFSSLRFSKGKTAIDFSEIPDGCDTGLTCCSNVPKDKPASARIESAAMPPTTSVFLFEILLGALVILVCRVGSCSRCATSEADCGRRDGSFARHTATASSQTLETNAGSTSNSFRRSVIEGATRSQICRSILPE